MRAPRWEPLEGADAALMVGYLAHRHPLVVLEMFASFGAGAEPWVRAAAHRILGAAKLDPEFDPAISA